MTSLDAQGSAVLGSHLADMHLHNLKQNKNSLVPMRFLETLSSSTCLFSP